MRFAALLLLFSVLIASCFEKEEKFDIRSSSGMSDNEKIDAQFSSNLPIVIIETQKSRLSMNPKYRHY